jgi:phenylacetate-CoA ligase
MKSFTEMIYYSSPVFLQNILISIYGYKLYRDRYNENARQYLSELRKSEYISKDQMQELQSRRFVQIARHAIAYVPHYRDWAAKEGLEVDDINSLDDLKLFPLLEKDDIRKSPERFISELYKDKSRLLSYSTSGTSGKPLTIICDANCRTHHYTFFTRLRSWFGINNKSTRATLFGRIIQLPQNKYPPYWRYDIYQRNLLMSSYHLNDDNLSLYYEKLLQYKPDEVIGYPSSLYQIAKFIINNKLPPLTPKVVFTTAETLLIQQREMLENAFACPVIDQYGCTEMAFFASQCEFGNMHIHPEHGIMEVLDTSGRHVRVGEAGNAVPTGLVNMVMPLIRYKIGDIIATSDKCCECGRAFPVISDIVGRLDDTLMTPDGRPLGRLDPIFKGLNGIYETQIIQSSSDTLEFNLVVDNSYNKQSERELMYEIRKRVGAELIVKLIYVASIPKNQNGKFKAVIRRSTELI